MGVTLNLISKIPGKVVLDIPYSAERLRVEHFELYPRLSARSPWAAGLVHIYRRTGLFKIIHPFLYQRRTWTRVQVGTQPEIYASK